MNSIDDYSDEASIGLVDLEGMLSYALELTDEHFPGDNGDSDDEGSIGSTTFFEEGNDCDDLNENSNKHHGFLQSYQGQLWRRQMEQLQAADEHEQHQAALDDLLDLYLVGHDSLRLHRKRFSEIMVDPEEEEDKSGLDGEDFEGGLSQRERIPKNDALEEEAKSEKKTAAVTSNHFEYGGKRQNDSQKNCLFHELQEMEEKVVDYLNQHEDEWQINSFCICPRERQDIDVLEINKNDENPDRNNKIEAQKECHSDETSCNVIGKAIPIAPTAGSRAVPANIDRHGRIKCAKKHVSLGGMPSAA